MAEEDEFTEMEDTKPEITTLPPMMEPLAAANEHHLYVDTSDSMPKLHTSDSSSSEEHVLTCDKEVQSEPKWNFSNNNPLDGSGGGLDFNFNFNFMESNSGFVDDPFGLQAQQYQMDQLYPDMFMLLPKPF